MDCVEGEKKTWFADVRLVDLASCKTWANLYQKNSLITPLVLAWDLPGMQTVLELSHAARGKIGLFVHQSGKSNQKDTSLHH